MWAFERPSLRAKAKGVGTKALAVETFLETVPAPRHSVATFTSSFPLPCYLCLSLLWLPLSALEGDLEITPVILQTKKSTCALKVMGKSYFVIILTWSRFIFFPHPHLGDSGIIRTAWRSPTAQVSAPKGPQPRTDNELCGKPSGRGKARLRGPGDPRVWR